MRNQNRSRATNVIIQSVAGVFVSAEMLPASKNLPIQTGNAFTLQQLPCFATSIWGFRLGKEVESRCHWESLTVKIYEDEDESRITHHGRSSEGPDQSWPALKFNEDNSQVFWDASLYLCSAFVQLCISNLPKTTPLEKVIWSTITNI